MNTASNALAALYRRDLSRLIQQVEAFPSDESLWQTLPGITNSAGTLVLHLEGNLREYIGRQLGQIPYSRNRPVEFTAKGLERPELVSRVDNLRRSIPSVIASLSPKTMEAQYPETVLEKPLSTQAFLTHLYGHLNWHLGQIDSLRRALSGATAIKSAGL